MSLLKPPPPLKKSCVLHWMGELVRIFMQNTQNSPKQSFFRLGIYSTVFQAEVLAVLEVAKNLLLKKMHNQSIVVLVDSQAAIKAPVPVIKMLI